MADPWRTTFSFITQQFHCDSCGTDITRAVGRFRCAHCGDFDLCVHCFGRGVDVGQHSKDHDYVPVGRLDFALYDPEWLAPEEFLLVEAVAKYGFGNWQDVAEMVAQGCPPDRQPKEKEECTHHYYETYVKYPGGIPPDSAVCFSGIHPELPESKHSTAHVHTDKESFDASLLYSDRQPTAGVNIVGYMPLRGDFECEYDNDAELLIADLEFRENDSPQEKELKLQLLENFNSRLDERLMRKRTIVSRNLLDSQRLIQTEKSRAREERELHTLLRSVARFQLPENHDRLVRLMVDERRLRRRIHKLQEWRGLGLKTQEDVARYEAEKAKTDQPLLPPGDLPNREDAKVVLNEPVKGESQKPGRRKKESRVPLVATTDAETELCRALDVKESVFALAKSLILQEMFKGASPSVEAAESFPKDLRLDVEKAGNILDFSIRVVPPEDPPEPAKKVKVPCFDPVTGRRRGPGRPPKNPLVRVGVPPDPGFPGAMGFMPSTHYFQMMQPFYRPMAYGGWPVPWRPGAPPGQAPVGQPMEHAEGCYLPAQGVMPNGLPYYTPQTAPSEDAPQC